MVSFIIEVILFPAAILSAWFFMLRRMARRGSFEGIMGMPRLVMQLALVAGALVVLVHGGGTLFGLWGLSWTDVLILDGVLFPLLLALVVFVHAGIAHILVNYKLYLYYRDGLVIEDSQTVARLTKYMRRFSWLHHLLFRLRGTSTGAVLSIVFGKPDT